MIAFVTRIGMERKKFAEITYLEWIEADRA